jgi:hypothetical protein
MEVRGRRAPAWYRRSWRWLTASAIVAALAAGAIALTPRAVSERADKVPVTVPTPPAPAGAAPADRG